MGTLGRQGWCNYVYEIAPVWNMWVVNLTDSRKVLCHIRYCQCNPISSVNGDNTAPININFPFWTLGVIFFSEEFMVGHEREVKMAVLYTQKKPLIESKPISWPESLLKPSRSSQTPFRWITDSNHNLPFLLQQFSHSHQTTPFDLPIVWTHLYHTNLNPLTALFTSLS